MHVQRGAADTSSRSATVRSWLFAASAALGAASAAATAVAVVRYLSLRTRQQRQAVDVNAIASPNYAQVRIAGAGRKDSARDASPVPPENPHAPPGR
ncbi:hypothetical protein GCM10027416_27270 [Okibacterium endophyticum]